MDAQLKAKWLEALRSGKYKQTPNSLRAGEGFCCLGVLCDISAAGKWEEDEFGLGYVIDDDVSHQYLPYRIRYMAGLNSDDCEPLINMNDDGAPFSQIADYIEAKL